VKDADHLRRIAGLLRQLAAELDAIAVPAPIAITPARPPTEIQSAKARAILQRAGVTLKK